MSKNVTVPKILGKDKVLEEYTNVNCANLRVVIVGESGDLLIVKYDGLEFYARKEDVRL
jgi:hypothetical protein